MQVVAVGQAWGFMNESALTAPGIFELKCVQMLVFYNCLFRTLVAHHSPTVLCYNRCNIHPFTPSPGARWWPAMFG